MARKFRPELQMKLLNEIFAISFFLQSFTKFKCCLYEWSVRRAWYTFKITFPFYQAETVTHVRRCVLTLICCVYIFLIIPLRFTYLSRDLLYPCVLSLACPLGVDQVLEEVVGRVAANAHQIAVIWKGFQWTQVSMHYTILFQLIL